MSKYNLSKTPTLWDAKQLIKSYVSLFYFRKDLSDDSEFANIPHSDQVRMKRLYSAICAFNNAEYDEGKVLSTIDETFNGLFFDYIDNEEYQSLIKDKLKEVVALANFELWPLEEPYSDLRQDLFLVFIEYRLKLEALNETFSDVWESTLHFSMGTKLVESLYSDVFKEKTEILEDFLALLLGEQFQNKSFTEDELKDNWHFPTETDSDLLDWDVDNF